MTKPTLSIVIPALNEEANISAAVSEVIKAVEGRCSEYELLLFNDGSRDRTGERMEQMAQRNSRIRVFHNAVPLNTGAVFQKGVSLARYEYVMMVPGDNENPSQALIGPMAAIGQADLIIAYTANPEVRPWVRRLISWTYQRLLNLLFGLRLKYYNGTSIYRTADLRRITIRSTSFAHLAERLIKLIRSGCSYVEVGIRIVPPSGRRSKAFRWKNLIGVSGSILKLFYEVCVLGTVKQERA